MKKIILVLILSILLVGSNKFGNNMLFNKNQDQALYELSLMLTQDSDNPTFQKDLLDSSKLDYSVSSLDSIQDYINKVKDKEGFKDEYNKTVLRLGAYVGQVIKSNSEKDYHWYDYDTAIKIDKSLESFGQQLGTSAVLISQGGNETIFPIAKVVKCIENGDGDSLVFYAKVILDSAKK